MLYVYNKYIYTIITIIIIIIIIIIIFILIIIIYYTHDRNDLKPFQLNHLLSKNLDCTAQASAPPFLLSLFLLSNACAFIYLLLAVWLSMHVRASNPRQIRYIVTLYCMELNGCRNRHSFSVDTRDVETQASIASHSFGVRLWRAQKAVKAVVCRRLYRWTSKVARCAISCSCEMCEITAEVDQIRPTPDSQHEANRWLEEQNLISEMFKEVCRAKRGGQSRQWKWAQFCPVLHLVKIQEYAQGLRTARCSKLVALALSGRICHLFDSVTFKQTRIE